MASITIKVFLSGQFEHVETVYVDNDALRTETLTLKAKIFFHLQTRALDFWPNQSLEADGKN